MQNALAALYGVLMLFAICGSVVAVCGAMNDRRNSYPVPMLIAAVVAGALGQALLRVMS
jgi:hypothetical protein